MLFEEKKEKVNGCYWNVLFSANILSLIIVTKFYMKQVGILVFEEKKEKVNGCYWNVLFSANILSLIIVTEFYIKQVEFWYLRKRKRIIGATEMYCFQQIFCN